MQDRIYFVRVAVPSIGKTLALATLAKGTHVESMMSRAAAERMDEDGYYEAVAIGSIHLRLQTAGLDVSDARVVECRSVTEAELRNLVLLYNPSGQA